MRASVSFYFDTMLYFLTEAIRASGFNYVTALGAHKEGGDIVWSES